MRVYILVCTVLVFLFSIMYTKADRAKEEQFWKLLKEINELSGNPMKDLDQVAEDALAHDVEVVPKVVPEIIETLKGAVGA